MSIVSIIGCGFVADLYMKSFESFPESRVCVVYDQDTARAEAFGAYWSVPVAQSWGEFVQMQAPGSLVLNLTNPSAHYDVTRRALDSGFHVYSEKPLATQMSHAQELYDLARARGLMLASAPCSVLGEAAQVVMQSVRDGVVGTPRLVYAELDDGFIPQAPHQDWQSVSGAPWPFEDEMQVGCTLEHAGYYLTWLIAIFGSVERVVAASAKILPDLLPEESAPDMSVAVLFFESGMVARLTCSIVAPHDHSLKVVGDNGVLKINRAWDNGAPVRFHRRVRIRRRLLENPIGKRQHLKTTPPPKVRRTGAASMNFALGPMEMLNALEKQRPNRLTPEFALHLNEVTLAIHNAGQENGVQIMQTHCQPMELLPWAG